MIHAVSRWLIRFWIILGCAVLATVPAAAQSLVPAEEAKAPVQESDAFGRETPRSTVTNLLSALASDDFTRAANYLIAPDKDDASQEPTQDEIETAARLAAKLNALLDAGGRLTPFARLSNDVAGSIDDDLLPQLENIGSLSLANGEEPILLRKYADAGWRIAPETLQIVEAASADEENPASQTSFRVAGAPVLDWLLLLGVAIGTFLALRLLAQAIIVIFDRILGSTRQRSIFRFLHAAMPPLALYASVLIFYSVAGKIEVGIIVRQTLLRYAGIVAWVALVWFLLRLVDAVAGSVMLRMHRAERRQAVSIVTFLRRVAKAILFAVAAIAVLDTLGLDVTTGIAALGIGGLALALGAQKTIENLVGSVTLIADQPFQVGDAAQIGDVFGTVEDIGMRATRVRTLTRTLVSIPNGNLASDRIENYALRDQFLFRHVIGVSYSTDADRMEQALTAIRTILRDDPDIIDDDARARFIGFAESTLQIEVFAYFRTTSFVDSLAMQEALLLTIMRKLAQLDVQIAFPTRTIALAREQFTRLRSAEDHVDG
ncbi:mechanosensitive ion channel family protein [Croceicoccus sp. F390]|uniref:Mechanosensitive ion channel family protein n=1 Tax=Croceicoccus esteveae TaxID=3075597 RepID=A0ABU2ZEZ9_9SPHN|nr:mechanosensitive ion channel family protein [Croceicoccus sp. F390]MDT0575170.1 mechanosensitive ion channel family protein [Croceicoccus sp. F390]